MRATAEIVHRHFAECYGAHHIASRFALEQIGWWARHRQPKAVLEIGTGIGTITRLLADAAPPWALIDTVEPEAWCREQADRHLAMVKHRHAKRRIVIFPTFTPKAYDFVVIDGGDRRDDYYANLTPRAVVIFEGNRRDQRRVFEALWSGGRAYVRGQWKPRDRSKGVWVYLLDPTLGERVWFLGVRIREAVLDGLARLRGRPVGKRRPP